MANVIWTPLAEADLEEILFFIAEQGRPSTAEKINREIRDKLAIYAESPSIGHIRSGFPEGVRFCIHKRWVIMYQANKVGIDILRVIDSARDFSKLFGK